MGPRETYDHRWLDCGIELGGLVIPGRRTTAFEIRVLAGMAHEPENRLGLARVVESTIAKGTKRRSAQQLIDAFDVIGAQTGSSVGREATVFRCRVLPEYLQQALELYAEMLREPVFPDEFCRVAVDLSQQELVALEDDPGELSQRLMAPHVYGPTLGRHELGTRETLASIGREDVVSYWKGNFAGGRMQMAVGGAVDLEKFCAQAERLFGGFGSKAAAGRDGFPVAFTPGAWHQPKELEQQHILIGWPGAAVTDAAFPVEQLVIAMLSEGMSSRLFVEVREKQGLVYWVGAWDEHPRKAGMIFLGASTTPARCEQTYRTLLREVDRLAEDVTEEELRRAKVGIIAKTQTHGDITRARIAELGSDLYHFGRPVPVEEKNRWIESVTIAQVQKYLRDYPRDRLCVFTLGPSNWKKER